MSVLPSPTCTDTVRTGRQTIHTHIVAKVHLRMAQWRRQVVTRAHPPRKLGNSFALSVVEPGTRMPFTRVFLAILCLGMPHVFLPGTSSRSRSTRTPLGRRASPCVLRAHVRVRPALVDNRAAGRRALTPLALPGLERAALGSFAASLLVSTVRTARPCPP